MAVIEHETLPIAHLSQPERGQMFRLMGQYYLGVDRETFERDLSEKEHVMILRDNAEAGRLVGFSTLMRLELNVGGQPVKAIFSGDTIVEEQKRTNVGFAYEVTQYFMRTLADFPRHSVYYVLISKGWRTYRILPFLFHDFAPHCAKPVDPKLKEVMNAFGAKKYPLQYNPQTGLIVFQRNAQRIRPDSAEAISRLRRDRHIDFFAAKNPHHLRGDELVCVAPVAESNFTTAFNKLLQGQEVCA